MPTFLVCAAEAHAGKSLVLKYVLVLVLIYNLDSSADAGTRVGAGAGAGGAVGGGGGSGGGGGGGSCGSGEAGVVAAHESTTSYSKAARTYQHHRATHIQRVSHDSSSPCHANIISININMPTPS